MPIPKRVFREPSSKPRPRLIRWAQAHRRGLRLSFWAFFSVSLGVGYYFLSQYLSLPMINPLGPINGEPLVALSDPILREVPHPLTGVYYSQSESESWSGLRPLGVMIDNHQLARPYQFGLQKADVIYEAVAEGGITRFLAVFHSNAVAKLGPVRSARVYYMGWALEFPSYYAHVGGATSPVSAADYSTFISQNGVLSLNQFRLGAPTFTFGGNVLLPGGGVLSHINYTSTGKLWAAGEKLYPGTNKLPNFARWKFKADAPYNARPDSQKVTFNFWSFPAAYQGEWRYNRETNSYLRFQGGAQHLDQATKEQLAARNVVLAHMQERSAGDGTARRLYTQLGQGDAEVYRDGQKILATWKRGSLSARMKFFKRGTSDEIEFNRGLTWIEIIPR